MKKFAFVIIISAFYLSVYAQTPAKEPATAAARNMIVEVSAGYSMAMGTYASSDKQNDKAGCATGGWQVQLAFDWLATKDFGLAIQYTFQRNPIENGFSKVYPNGIPASSGSAAWTNNYLLAGPVFMKQIRRLHLDAKVLGGVIVSSGACFDTPDPTDTAGYNSNIAAGFGYQFSAGAGYAILPHLVIKFNLGLQGGWPAKSRQYGSKFIGYEEYIDPKTGLPYYEAIYSAPVTYDMEKVVTTLNPSIGLVYRF